MFAHFGPNLQLPFTISGWRDARVTPTHLCKVLANIVVCACEVMAEGASSSSLTCSLPEELAWYVGGVFCTSA
jgi:hypothetical protein